MRPFDELMRQELLRATFDFERPEPITAWEAFKFFAIRPIAGQKTIAIGFSCCHAADRDDTLWLEFARQLEDEEGLGQRCGCAFSRQVPTDLRGVDAGNWWWTEHGTLDEWFRDVEAMPEFMRCLALCDWHFEGYSL